MNESNIIWEEKNLIEQSKKFENNGTIVPNDTIKKIKQQSVKRGCNYIGRAGIVYLNLALDHSRKMTALYANSEEMRLQAKSVQIERYKNPEERLRTSESIKNAYKNNPEFGRKVSINQILSNKNNPEKGRIHSLKIGGHNHPCYDDTIYKFKNEVTNEIFDGSKYDFRKKYNLSQSKVSLLTHGKKRMHKNWIL